MQFADLRFLAVEDHEFQRSMLVRILGSLGAQNVAVAADGHAALAIVDAPDTSLDIIISDLDMPGMDGMEFMRRLSERKVAVSIILTSALEASLLASVETMTRAYGVRILGVIEKPITPAKLATLVGLHTPPQAKQVRPPGTSFTIEEIVRGMTEGEFEPFFQPKVEFATGRVQGAEALARWRRPDVGVIAPYAFIGALEQHGQIDVLTWIILEKSAAFCLAWRNASGLDVSVSVNLSTKSLGDPQLAERVTDIVRSQGLGPKHIVLEVTESATTVDIGHALENLSRLRMRGFGLSIDDYGTGYSSMQQLTRIPFSELKIDQSFVALASRQHSARVILKSSLDMAKKLNITSVAEGVETQEDWDLLAALGYELAQGYFIARPMEGGALLDWTKGRSAVA